MVRINVNRLNYIRSLSGIWLVVFASTVISALVVLGFWYDVEFAQAVFLLAFPLSIVAGAQLPHGRPDRAGRARRASR
jgi:hypothetical protein